MTNGFYIIATWVVIVSREYAKLIGCGVFILGAMFDLA